MTLQVFAMVTLESFRAVATRVTAELQKNPKIAQKNTKEKEVERF